MKTSVEAETGVILAVTEGRHPRRERLRNLESLSDFEIHHVASVEAGEAWLTQCAHAAVDIITIGPDVSHPVSAARRLRRTCPTTQVLFLVPVDSVERFSSILPFALGLDDAWIAEATAPADYLKRIMANALRVGRQRRQAADLSHRLNRMLARGPTADEENRRQHRMSISESYLASLLSQAADPIFATDISGNVLAWNDRAAELFGWGPDRDAPFELVLPLPAAQRSGLGDLIRRARRGEAIAGHELHIEPPGRHPLDLEFSLTPVRHPAAGIISISFVARDITERNRTRQRLEAALAEKEVLLKEVHHRVKNNLQMITSLLHLRAISLPPESKIPFIESASRIHAMARLHDKLSAAANLSSIQLKAFVADLCSDLAEVYGVKDRVHFGIDVGDVSFDLHTATPIALLLNELISNCCKHAFPDQRAGNVHVSARYVSSGVELVVRDDGVGIPGTGRPGLTSGLGLKIIEALLKQIEAHMQVLSESGATVVVSIACRSEYM